MTRRNAIIITLLLAVAAGVIFLYARSRAPESPVNTVDIRIPLTYTQPLVIAMFDLGLSITPLEAQAAAKSVEAENRFRYIDAYPNTDVVQTRLTNKLKEEIILKSPGHPERFSYMIDDEWLESQFDSEENLHLYPLGTDMSQTRFLIPAPYLIDAKGEKSATKDVIMTFKDGTLTLVPNPAWLSSHPYPITLDPTVEIMVLNVNSVPTVGGPWEVRFTTIGADTLVISGDPKNTVYGVNVEPESLSCGNEDRTDMLDRSYRTDKSYVFEGWSCDTEATWTVKVLKPGHHHQIFTFGGQTAEANNDTVSNDWCGGLNTFSYRRKITLNNSSQASALTNFPAMVALTQAADVNNIDYTKTQDSGQDIRFCDQDNATRLEYEIEKWNESATSTIWVKIPNLTAASSTEHIWMYYGNTSTTTAATTTGVWDANFKGAWHLKEDPTPASSPNGCDGDTKEVCDSTSNNNDGDSNGTMTSADQVTAKVDGGIDFDGTDDYVTIPDSSTLELTAPSTIEFWFKTTQTGNKVIIEKNGDSGFSVQREFGGDGLDNGVILEFGGTATNFSTNHTYNDGNWHHVAFVVQTTFSNSKVYVDGVDDTRGTPSGAGTPTYGTESLYVGSRAGSYGYAGSIDEIRLFNVARSADWIAFEYCNMNFTCQTYGAEEYFPRPANVPGVKFR